jgi:hypothetical protein
VDRDLRVSGSGFGRWSPFSDNPFPFVDANEFVFHDVPEGFGPLYRYGIAKGNMVFIELRDQQSPFGRYLRHGMQAFLSEFLYSWCHIFMYFLIFCFLFIIPCYPPQHFNLWRRDVGMCDPPVKTGGYAQ